MRKWWRWAIGSGLLLAGAAALLLLLPAPAPFAFLEGHRPTNVALPPGRFVQSDYAVYSFKDSFLAFNEKAATELKRKGFRAGHISPAGPVQMVYYTKPAKTVGETDEMTVMVYRDMRYDIRGTEPEPGWVMVVLMAVPQPTPFDRMKDWLGI
jgi:hypothetical protein